MRSILICDPGRCGSHWLLYMLRSLTGLTSPLKSVPPDYFPRGHIWGTRLRLPLAVLELAASKLDVVFLVRDPRDVVVSMQLYDLHVTDGFGTRGCAASAISQVMDWVKWYLWAHDQVQSQTVRYEDLWRDCKGTLIDLIAALDRRIFAPKAMAVIIQAQSFKARTGRERGEEDVTAHLRKGVVGDWRNRWPAGQAQRFWEEYGGVMEELGYAH